MQVQTVGTLGVEAWVLKTPFMIRTFWKVKNPLRCVDGIYLLNKEVKGGGWGSTLNPRNPQGLLLIATLCLSFAVLDPSVSQVL